MPDPIVSLNEESSRAALGELVRRTVEDILNGLLEEEAGDLVGAELYGRTAEREAHRAGHYDRSLTTSSGKVTIRAPKPEGMRLAMVIIERYRRRGTSVEEAMIETCLAGVSTRRIEDVSEILWGSCVSASTVPDLIERAFALVEERRNRPLDWAYPYVYVDGIYLKKPRAELRERGRDGAHGRERRRLPRGYRRRRGAHGFGGVLAGVPLVAEVTRAARDQDVHRGQGAGMVGSIAEIIPEAAYQRCTVHFYRNALTRVPKSKRPGIAAMPEAIHAMESREAFDVAGDLGGMRLKEAAKVVRDSREETLTYTRFPREHWRRIRTNNTIERLNREMRRRTRVVGTFPDGKSALMLVTARLKYIAESEWGSRRYLDVTLLEG